MEFTRKSTNIAKGIAICLMFANHLYTFKDRLLHGNSYIPIIPFFDTESYIGSFGKICISMFLFLSGYGMFLGYIRSQRNVLSYSINKLKDFYVTYWFYFLIFIPIGIIFFKHVTFWQSSEIRYSSEPLVFLANFLGLSSTYNSEWWFVHIFVTTTIVVFPIYAKLAQRNIILLCLLSLSLFLLCLKLNINRYDDIFGFTFWQISFALGIVCAQLKFFSSHLIQDFDKHGWILIFPGLIFCFIFRLRFGGTFSDFLIVPFFIYFTVRAVSILNLSTVFSYLGKYSFQLWLIHTFFCYYYFQDIIYFPKWSPFIFAFLTGMSICSVLGIEYLRSFLQFEQLMTACTEKAKKLWLHLKFTRRQ
ncbi:acyltransferase family protein [Tumidithrix elongata RA019]|uniref:Acyltransferase family protein n=1 Tax=Tumidithrix elongata BACA0141 TaxID=2716417 RepID=A0AAW9Q644_9CYAN|nr:acyltransferase family protein [Tumidithrix elongata RA019]